MATVILVRHGRTTANASGVLAGRSNEVRLDATGQGHADALALRLAPVKAVELVISPLTRCRETAEPIATATGLVPVEDEGLLEVDYGTWQGRAIVELLAEPLWTTVQATPSDATFPEGECLGDMGRRAAGAVRARDAAVEAAYGAEAVWIAVSHGDVIKAALADALGLPLDLFQRISVDPGSASIIRYGATRPTVLGMNTHAGDLSWLAATTADDDAQIGGGAGPAASADAGA